MKLFWFYFILYIEIDYTYKCLSYKQLSCLSKQDLYILVSPLNKAIVDHKIVVFFLVQLKNP